jgi:hypothetical protein
MYRQLSYFKMLTFAGLLAGMTAATSPAPAQTADLGVGASLHGSQIFPLDNAWNLDISRLPVDANSTNLLTSIGLTTGLHPDFGAPYNGVPNGIPYVVVPGTQSLVPVAFQYASESDPGPYPLPTNAPIEGGPGSTGDRHVLVVDRDRWILHEIYSAYPNANYTAWSAGSGAVFNLNSNTPRPQGWTSADAAGLPVFPGLVRYDEVFEQGAILHALRFTVQRSRRGFVYPASHFASRLTGANLPPMGMRVRLKASFNVSTFPPSVQVVLTALKKYGMIVADNGSNWFVSGAPDNRWNDSDLHTLGQVHGSDFEVVQMGPVTTDALPVPTNLNATAGMGRVSLAWTASANAAGYLVKRSTGRGGPYTTITSAGGATNFTDTSVVGGTAYYYVVSGMNTDQQSFDTPEVSAIPVADFTLSASPSSQTVAQGAGTSYTVTVTPSGGFNGTVTFSGTGLPSGATAGFSPSSVVVSGASTLSVTAGASTLPGTYPLSLTATSGMVSHTVAVTLVVKAPIAGIVTLTALTLDKTQVKAYIRPTATITLSGIPSGPVTVHMTSSNPTLAPVSDRVLWGSSRTLQIPTYPVTQPTLITITASYNGVVKTAMFTIVP